MMRSFAVALLLGAATVFGFAPFGIYLLPLLTLAGLFRLWDGCATPGRAAALGYVFGLGYFLAGVSWIYVSMHQFGGMAPALAALATLLFCAAMALHMALPGYLFARLRVHAPWRDALLAGGLWALVEWLRGALLTGFPWLGLGHTQAPPSPLAGFAPLIGSYGLALLVACGAGLLAFVRPTAQAALSRFRRMPWVPLAVIGGIFLLGFLLRGIAWTDAVGAPTRIALLQGNVPQGVKWDPQRLATSLDTYVRLAQRYPADLVVLPETAIPLFFDEVPPELLADLTRHGSALIGVAVRYREAGRLSGYTNGAVAVSRRPEGGFATAAYAKHHLLPFGEYAPPGFSWFFQLASIPMADFTAGPQRQPPLAIAGQKIAPNICYEDAFGEEIIAALPEATLLINLSNTAWFGDSLAQPQHLQIAQLRALETGRPMLRATNTGMTAAITPDGRIAAVLEPFTTGALRVDIQGYQGMTPFARFGNATALALMLLACLPALLRRRLMRRA